MVEYSSQLAAFSWQLAAASCKQRACFIAEPRDLQFTVGDFCTHNFQNFKPSTGYEVKVPEAFEINSFF